MSEVSKIALTFFVISEGRCVFRDIRRAVGKFCCLQFVEHRNFVALVKLAEG